MPLIQFYIVTVLVGSIKTLQSCSEEICISLFNPGFPKLLWTQNLCLFVHMFVSFNANEYLSWKFVGGLGIFGQTTYFLCGSISSSINGDSNSAIGVKIKWANLRKTLRTVSVTLCYVTICCWHYLITVIPPMLLLRPASLPYLLWFTGCI